MKDLYQYIKLALKQSIDKGRQRRALAGNYKDSNQEEHYDYREQPPFFPFLHEAP